MEFKNQVEKNNENLMVRNDRIKRLERLKYLKIEENRRLINERYNRTNNIKEQ